MEKEIAEKIKSSAEWLRSLGFEPKPDDQEVVYDNGHILISFCFIKGAKDQSLLTTVKKCGENKSYFLNELLMHLGRKTVDYTQGESSESYIERNIEVLRDLVWKDLKEVVSGRNWIEVPRDYMGYK